MPPTYFPLRWESTGDQWWYASPIDWAVANGHYDLVLELLRIDGNHLIKLTSLRRIRRLESVWDDEVQFYDVAMCRSLVARKLLLQFNTKNGNNSLIQAGYGGWLMYTAASAGDLGFVQQLLERNPLLVFGEGEYGVTDILYAAARSKNSEVFRLLFEFAVSPRFVMAKSGELVEHIGNNIPSVYKWEMINRAIHAAARGGNLKILKELLADCSDVLTYRDVNGSTILHTAAGRGKVEVLNYLIDTCEIMTSTDHQGNTALHVAAHRAQLAAVEALISLSPSSVYSRNSDGETFLHKAVSGFQTHSFRRLDKQIDLLKQLVCGKIFCVQDIINAKNKVERTALHMAIIGNIHSDLVKLLMTAQSIDVNVRDAHDMTPLDYLRQRPQSALSDILIRQLISAGGIISCQDYSARKVFASCLKMQSNGISPGTSFRISDREIFLHTGIELNISHPSNLELGSPGIELNISHPNDLEQGSSGMSSSSVEQSSCGSTDGNHISFASTKPGSINSAAKKILKSALHWRKIKEKQTKKFKNSDDTPTQQKNRFFNISALAKKKRTLSDRCNQSNPPAKKKFASGLRSGVKQVIPHNTNQVDIENEIARLSCSNQVDCDYSTQYFEKQRYVSKQRMRRKYFCFGKSRCFSVNDPVSMQLPVASVA